MKRMLLFPLGGWLLVRHRAARPECADLDTGARFPINLRLTRSRTHLPTWLTLLATLCSCARAATTPSFDLSDGDRVLFIGDTFFERDVDYGHIETRLTAAFPDRQITFRNLAWAADTPMGRSRASFDWSKPEEEWLNRVKEQVALVKPTVAFLSYGMTSALEAAEARKPVERQAVIDKFKTDLYKLMDVIEEVSGRNVKFVLLGPVRFVQLRANLLSISNDLWVAQDGARSLVEETIREVAAARKQRFVPLKDFAWSEK